MIGDVRKIENKTMFVNVVIYFLIRIREILMELSTLMNLLRRHVCIRKNNFNSDGNH